jgi:RND family efflux transporter MFP subunit
MADIPQPAARDLSALRIHRDEKPPGGVPRLGLLVLALLAGGGWYGWTRYTADTRLPEVEIGTARFVGISEAGGILSASGHILPNRKADVSSKTFGRLEWMGIDVGSTVKKDEVIARLADADLSALVEEAKASMRDAEREHARWTKIVEQGIEPKERLDKAETHLELARARLKQAEAALEYTRVRAPFDGVVVKRLAQIGETVGPAGAPGAAGGGAVCTIVDRGSLEMVADVNEANIGKVRVGQACEVAADARPDRKYKGEVRQIVPTADRQKGTVPVKIRVLDLDEALLPEMAARATFLREGAAAGGAKRLMAPRGALRERNGTKVVFVIEGGRARVQAVVAGAEGEDGVEVTSGLLGGEQVVTGGAAVEDGQAVRIKGAAAR